MLSPSRAIISLLSCIGLAACAGYALPPDPVTGAASGRIPTNSSIEYRDTPIRVIQPALPQVKIANSQRLGNNAAKIGIIEFSDYQCIYCAEFHRKKFPRIRKEYVDTGVVLFIHKDLPLPMHPQAMPAAIAARCAGAQGRFWDMHDALFAHQDKLNQNSYPGLAKELKLDEAKFRACFENKASYQDIGKDVKTARALGLGGTPSFLIGTIQNDVLTVMRQSSGAPDFSEFAREIEKLR